MTEMQATRSFKGRILRLAAFPAAVAATVISLGNHFLMGVTPEQEVQFYIPVVLGQCLFVFLVLYAASLAYLRPVFNVLDNMEGGKKVNRELAARARRATFNYPLDMLLFIAFCGIGLILLFHFSEWFFFYKREIQANWWAVTLQNATFELTLVLSLAMVYFVFSRGLMREHLEQTTSLAPDEGKRLAIKSRLLITVVSLEIIAASVFLQFYLVFPMANKSLPIGVFPGCVFLVTVFCIAIGTAVSSDTTRDIVLVKEHLSQITRGIQPGQHRTLAVTSLDEVGDLVIAFNQMQQRVAAIYRDVDRELSLARAVQIKLLPKGFPVIPGWEIAGLSLPARQVGGDFYDCIPLSGGRFGLAVGDAAGKGMPAALLMSAVIGMLRAEAPREANPAEVLRKVNNLICDTVFGGMFITALYAVFDPVAGTCTLASAGHLSPVRFFPGDKEPELAGTGALPLGLEQNLVYREKTLAIPAGGGIIFYSDGIVEARNTAGELFGFERFLNAGRSFAGLGVETFTSNVMNEVNRFAAGDQEDDITLLVVRRV